MEWFSITIHCRAAFAENAADVLEMLGARGVLIMDQAGEAAVLGMIEEGVRAADVGTGLDPDRYVGVTGYYAMIAHEPDRVVTEARRVLQARQQVAAKYGIDPGDIEFTLGTHSEKEWEEAWKAGFKALRIGSRLLVSPPWDVPQPSDPVTIVITIDPGMAFGTGTHPTTRMCLMLLERWIKAGDIVADAGTGSGVLAIAAAKLGARKVYAWDHDPVAVRSALRNVESNSCGDIIEVFVHESRAPAVENAQLGGANHHGAETDGPLRKAVGACNLVVANIAADTLAEISDTLKSLLMPGGLLVLSGIILEKEARCLKLYRQKGFSVVERLQEDEWVACCLRMGDM